MTSPSSSRDHVQASVSLSDLSVVCTIDYRYDWGWFGGNGRASAGGSRQSLTTSVELPRPPARADAKVLSCSSNVDLTQLSFSGGILSKIADLFKSLFRGKLEDVLEDVLCDELGTLGSDLLTSLTSGMHEAIFEYVPPAKGGTYSPPLRSADPLKREREMDAAYQSSLISWSDLLRPDAAQHPNNTVGHPDADPIALMGLVPQAFAAADAYLSERRRDKSSTTEPKTEDLGINCLLREQGIVDPVTGLIEVDLTNSTNPEGMVFYGRGRPVDTHKNRCAQNQCTRTRQILHFCSAETAGAPDFLTCVLAAWARDDDI